MSEGKKFDQGKTQWDLIPVDLLEKLADIFTLGSEKYGPENWKDVEDAPIRYYNSTQRHLTKYKKWLETGDRSFLINEEDGDADNLAGAAASIFIIWWLSNNPESIVWSDSRRPKWASKELSPESSTVAQPIDVYGLKGAEKRVEDEHKKIDWDDMSYNICES